MVSRLKWQKLVRCRGESLRDYTQEELAAMFEYQQGEEGQAALTISKEFLKNVHEKIGLYVPTREVGKIIYCQTGEVKYYLKG